MRALREQVDQASSLPSVSPQPIRPGLTQPTWLRPGAEVLVRTHHHPNAQRKYTVRRVEWPWLVFFEGVPGAAAPANVLRLA